MVYRQLQPDENNAEDCGVKIYLGSKQVYRDTEMNFKCPLSETDGLIFLDGYKGKFTELRFWNTNLSKEIIQETYKRPLD